MLSLKIISVCVSELPVHLNRQDELWTGWIGTGSMLCGRADGHAGMRPSGQAYTFLSVVLAAAFAVALAVHAVRWTATHVEVSACRCGPCQAWLHPAG